MKELINSNLVSLKCVLSMYFAGVGCLFPFLPLHIRAVGITVREACLISIVAPCFAILGPLIVGFLADKFSVGRGCETTVTSNGKGAGLATSNAGNRFLRFLLAACLLLAALFYALLLAVPTVTVLEPRRPSVNFMCDTNGASVFQEMCAEGHVCNHWSNEKAGTLELSDCRYACEHPPVARHLGLEGSSTPAPEDYDSYDGEPESGDEEPEPEAFIPDGEDDLSRNRRDSPQSSLLEPPHLCHKKAGDDVTLCHAYTEDTRQLVINLSLLSGIQEDYENENDTAWCKYPLGGAFQCLVPASEVERLAAMEDNSTCKPIIECNVENPYDAAGSVLAESQCKLYIGDPDVTFWMYIVFRILADIFATAALCLLCTVCVIATRETSVGRGDIGRQLAFGALGMALLPPLACLLHELVVDEAGCTPYAMLLATAALLFVIAAIITLCAKEMPVSPPEWWWHTKSGMLALPMNTVRRYGMETAGVVFVLVVLGIFWSALDSYLAWPIQELKGSDMLLSLTMTVGAIPAIPVLWKAEKLVDYCGHSNIFIGAFTFYIIRFTGMALLESPWWVLAFEVMEVFTLSLMWVTAVLYFRHLAPRRLTSCGQALPVVAHFCLGRCLGAVVGTVIGRGPALDQLQLAYRGLAIAACVLAILYFLLYHLLLAPLCRAASSGPPDPMLMQGLTTNGASNGSYTPLRVYHNERGRKGQFRY